MTLTRGSGPFLPPGVEVRTGVVVEALDHRDERSS
jgi:hypothetical protein